MHAAAVCTLPLTVGVATASAPATLTRTSAPGGQWNAVTVGSDGRKLTATTVFGIGSLSLPGVIFSTDGGTTWRNATDAPPVGLLAASASGDQLVGVTILQRSTSVHTSRDSGKTWALAGVGALVNKTVTALASSADGKKIVLAATSTGKVQSPESAQQGGIWLSDDGGKTFVRSTGAAEATVGSQLITPPLKPTELWRALAVSADGRRILALQSGNLGQAISTDGGKTWRSVAGLESVRSPLWETAASSFDGRTMYAAGANGTIWVTKDGAGTWTNTSAPDAWWTSVSTSASGRVVVAACQTMSRIKTQGGLFVSRDGGASFARVAGTNDDALKREDSEGSEPFWSSVAVSGDGKTFVAGVFNGGLFAGQVVKVAVAKAPAPGAVAKASAPAPGTRRLLAA